MQTALTIEEVLSREPMLCYSGFRNESFYSRPLRPAQSMREFVADRRRMIDERSVQEFNRAVTWLIRQPRVKHPNPRAGTSYRLKHVAEHEMGMYISNGMFLCAAISLGFTYERNFKTEYGGVNAWINIGVHMTGLEMGGLLAIVDGM
jgi:hypothetical protein